MAPVGIELIGESISRSSEGPQECLSCANICAAGSFFVGFSSGFAMLVACKKTLPRRVSSIVAFPTVVGLSAALMTHRHQVSQCEKAFGANLYFKQANTVHAAAAEPSKSITMP